MDAKRYPGGSATHGRRMRAPLPTNRLVALTLVGALLTGVVAVGLALPGFGPAVAPDDPTSGDTAGNVAAAAGAPTPNPNFTPAVSGTSGDGDHDDDRDDEAEEHGEHEDDEHEEEEGEE